MSIALLIIVRASREIPEQYRIFPTGIKHLRFISIRIPSFLLGFFALTKQNLQIDVVLVRYEHGCFIQVWEGDVCLSSGLKTNNQMGYSNKIKRRGLLHSNENYFVGITIGQRRKFREFSRKDLSEQRALRTEKIPEKYWSLHKLNQPNDVAPKIYFRELTNATILRENVIVSKEGYTQCESFLPVTAKSCDVFQIDRTTVIVRKNLLLLEAQSKEQQKWRLTAVYFGSRKDSYFYHAFAWTLAKFIAWFNEYDSLDSVELIFNKGMNENVLNYIKELLCAGDFNYTISFVDEMSPYFVKHIKVATLTLDPEISLPNVLSDHFLNRMNAETNSERNLDTDVLVLVRNSKILNHRHKPSNWNALVEKLESNFVTKVVDLAELGLFEQFRVLAQSRVIIGEHGGSFSLTPMLPPPKLIIELLTSITHQTFFNLLNQTNLNHFQLFLDCLNEFEIPIDSILDIVKRFLREELSD